jgi:hypothetical protein
MNKKSNKIRNLLRQVIEDTEHVTSEQLPEYIKQRLATDMLFARCHAQSKFEKRIAWKTINGTILLPHELDYMKAHYDAITFTIESIKGLYNIK